MIARFGEEIFNKGFDIIKLNRVMIYETDGEKKLEKLLECLGYSDDEMLKLFIDMCSTYLLLQSIKI